MRMHSLTWNTNSGRLVPSRAPIHGREVRSPLSPLPPAGTPQMSSRTCCAGLRRAGSTRVNQGGATGAPQFHSNPAASRRSPTGSPAGRSVGCRPGAGGGATGHRPHSGRKGISRRKSHSGENLLPRTRGGAKLITEIPEHKRYPSIKRTRAQKVPERCSPVVPKV
jgi:hypothetical protein